MLIELVHNVLAVAGCYGLWRLWRYCVGQAPSPVRTGEAPNRTGEAPVPHGSADRRVMRLVAAGFLLRTLAGQLLFWISYLRLPLGRSLQLERGFWFFGLDGWWYTLFANQIVGRGFAAFFTADATYPSHFFVQVLTVFVALFGGEASVGILLNAAAYLATCAIIVRLQPRVSTPVLFALAAVAFGPATVVWTLQPLKDTVFQLLIASLIAVCQRWQQRQTVGAAAAILALDFAIAGIRWYIGVIVWVAGAVFFLLVIIRSPRRWRVLAASAAVFVLLAQAARLGAGADIPASVERMLDPRLSIVKLWRPSQVTQTLARARGGFERAKGATTIAAGPALGGRGGQGAGGGEPVAPPPQIAEKVGGGRGAGRGERAIVTTPVPVTPTTTTVAPATPKPIPPPHRAPRPAPRAPEKPTFASRALSGAAAAFLPRTVAQAFGLIRVGGGRGLWLFAEADTLAFDAVLLFALVYCVRSRRRVTPLFVMLLLVFVLTAAPLVYTVSNFGTLFRLRQMLYFVAAMLPVTLTPDSRE